MAKRKDDARKASEQLEEVLAALQARGQGRMLPDRTRIVELLDLLGNPQKAYPAIHLTGTNGKTSTARIIDSLLRAQGLRVGRYTSPHLDSPAERISLDGEPIDPERFVAAYRDVAPYVQLMDERNADPVTYFELMTAMAFAAFADAPVDVAVVEVGLGGTWDATNVIDAGVAVVTPIGLDHVELLGPTIADIAKEKAGIIHEGATVVTAVQPAEAAEPLLRRAVDVGATVAREGQEFGVVERQIAVGGQMLWLQGLSARYEEIFLPLQGAHQAQNAALALAAVEAFLGAGRERSLDADGVREGFAEVSSPGRLERVRTSPTVLLDAAHNTAGMQALVDALREEFAFSRLVAVLGVLADKDTNGMLELLEPYVDAVVVTQNSSPRALPADDLAAVAVEIFGADRVDVELRLDDAIEAAVRRVEEDPDAPLGGQGVIITGSVVTVADARRLLAR
ncbi:bifunctional folylpolyglutamate synthase/dihydrofolate synthase [Fodinicola acaciae]|uniref:bifunctional folylpolyglutamate synthase/dihydrofolate synthase n=1 Tax=Fodinicola acaciae TaxID=2681555 RepID=UPI0013D2B583|nr:folylpolyglutamate synthase/dihydrofolate synthase family protein [Fodinicola acaciae]